MQHEGFILREIPPVFVNLVQRDIDGVHDMLACRIRFLADVDHDGFIRGNHFLEVGGADALNKGLSPSRLFQASKPPSRYPSVLS